MVSLVSSAGVLHCGLVYVLLKLTIRFSGKRSPEKRLVSGMLGNRNKLMPKLGESCVQGGWAWWHLQVRGKAMHCRESRSPLLLLSSS